MTSRVATLLVILGSCVLVATAWAEYRAYELEVVDLYQCRVLEKDPCDRAVVRTSLSPDTYARNHGGADVLGVILLATWMCYGDTSNYLVICPRPLPREGRFSAGEQVRVVLDKHITAGWEGTVELAYYQRSVNSNVYGVRFVNRQNVYARYFEKDLRRLDNPPPDSAAASSEQDLTPPQREPPQ